MSSINSTVVLFDAQVSLVWIVQFVQGGYILVSITTGEGWGLGGGKIERSEGSRR